MQTVTVEIINNKAIQLLEDLESHDLILLHKHNTAATTGAKNNILQLKGAMSKQSVQEIEEQINTLRNEWE